MSELAEVRIGRNFIRVGERHHVVAAGGDKTGFDLWIARMTDRDGVIEVTGTVCRPHKHAGKTKTVTLDRVRRKAQTKKGKAL